MTEFYTEAELEKGGFEYSKLKTFHKENKA